MKQACLETMSDRQVVERLAALLREERRLTAAVLVHLGEVAARRLYLPAACSSMHVYCVRVLGMSDDQAFKRIRAARAVRRFPEVAAAVEDGRLHLTGVVLLAPHLTEENAAQLVDEASGKSKKEIEILLARRAPRSDVPERLERVAEQGVLVAPEPVEREVVPGPVGREVVPGPVGREVVSGPARRAANVVPLSAERFALQLTIGEATRSKLLRAQALLRHQVPSGDLAEVLDRALDALLEKVEARKFGRVKSPRTAKASRSKRYVLRAARRQALARDGARCAFVAENGRRCEETGFLELDHLVPVAQGGDAGGGVRILCRSHNQYEAERILGRAAVEAGRAGKATDADLIAGLRRLVVTASDARRAVATSRGAGAVEARLRAALCALQGLYASRGSVAGTGRERLRSDFTPARGDVARSCGEVHG